MIDKSNNTNIIIIQLSIVNEYWYLYTYSQWRSESYFSGAIASGFWGVVVGHNLIKPTYTVSL